MSATATASGRAQPLCCPYCGETDIYPREERNGYHCAICDRLWRLTYDGLAGSAAS